MESFSLLDRDQMIQDTQNQEFDLLIIGGGVTGCGIALDAASRGLSTCLIEKKDFASGTSSKSTKLIHGGLRYLKQLEFGLVKESGTERAILHKLAPHLIVPEKMLLPIIKGGNFNRFMTQGALTVYDWLAGVSKDDKKRMLSKEETLAREPLLSPQNLLGSGYYSEYRTDDARLTIELAKTAKKYGAICLNYFSGYQFQYTDGQISAVCCHDELTKQEYVIRSKVVVSAAGPWVDELRKLDGDKMHKHLFLTKGVHLVFDYEDIPVNQSIYFDAPDGRMVFAIPRGANTYVGTTDTKYQEDKDDIGISQKDVDYLIEAVHYVFPNLSLDQNSIRSSWAGLRPLIHESGKSPSDLSRKDEIFESDSGLISIAGGKLTGYRMMAKRIIDKVCSKLKRTDTKCKTSSIPLTDPMYPTHAEYKTWMAKMAIRYPQIDSHSIFECVHLFGLPSENIFERRTMKTEVDLILAETDFCIDHEMCCTLEDFFERRTGRLYFNISSVRKSWPRVLEQFAQRLNWGEARKREEEKRIKKALARADLQNVIE